MPLTPKQMLYLALAWQCFESEPKIDYARLATLASLSSPASARELVRQSKKKLFEENSITDDLINKPSPAADATKPTKAKKATGTKKPIGRPRKKLASLAADADDDDTKSHPDVDEQSSAADADADTPTPSIPKALAGKGKPRAPATTTAHHPELASDTDVNVDDETDKAGTAIQATIGNKSAKGPKGTGKAAGAAAAAAKKRRAPGAADEAVGPMGLLDEGTVAKKVKKGGVKVKAETTQDEEIWTEGLGIEDGEEGEMAF